MLDKKTFTTSQDWIKAAPSISIIAIGGGGTSSFGSHCSATGGAKDNPALQHLPPCLRYQDTLRRVELLAMHIEAAAPARRKGKRHG